KIKTQLIYVTHHIDEILPLTTHVLFLKNGTIFSHGSKNKMLTGPKLSDAFDCHIELEKRSERYWITESRTYD
ncbi:MAG: ABC transporter, partial [Nitrospinaceae bacterium]